MKNRLANIRIAKDWSQQQLSIISHISRSTINAIEMGDNNNPSIRTALRLAKALHTSVESIFWEE